MAGLLGFCVLLAVCTTSRAQYVSNWQWIDSASQIQLFRDGALLWSGSGPVAGAGNQLRACIGSESVLTVCVWIDGGG